MITGYATPEGTANFAVKNTNAISNNFRLFHGLTFSNVGMGTYLGNPDDETDTLVISAIKKSINAGFNIIDTAINYRSQKAERSVGKAVSELIDEKIINRNEIFISTKNGYVTNDGDIKEDFWKYVNREYVSKGVIKSNDISSGYHCMSVPYLEDQLNRSRKNMNLECIDLIYLHNPVEGQIQDISKEQLMKNLELVFEFYEKKRKEEVIRYYGLATWNCFRVKQDDPQFLSLQNVVNLAEKVGGKNHGLKFIQLPYNLYLDQALMIKNQPFDSMIGTIFDSAKAFDVGVFSSVPLMQAKLLSPGVIPEFGDLKPNLKALQFTRSTPGILAPLVGHKSESHVKENLEIMKIPPMNENEFQELVKKLTSK
jgi:aryl-alcohol dehydrogenase-like predicted oxidoreductase